MSSNKTQVTFTPTAYSLLLLHAARHPQNTVTGFLLGSVVGSQVTVEKVITLAHHWTNLAAIEDVALSLLDNHLKASSSSDKLSLLGIYEAPATAKASSPSFAAIRLAKKVAQRSSGGAATSLGGSLVVLLDVSQLILIPPKHTLTPFVVSTNASTAQALPSPTTLQDEQETIARTLKAIREQGLWKDVRDFDDHLEDTSVNWLDNPSATKSLQATS